ncbi:MAG: hypothetical protein ABGY13_07720, partial [Verrucomicrobiia bacterium]
DAHKPFPLGGFYHCQPTLQGGSVGRMTSHPLPHRPWFYHTYVAKMASDAKISRRKISFWLAV